MSLKRFWRKAKHVLAFVLAITLFFNGWANYDFSVFAGDKPLTVTLTSSSAVYTGNDLTPAKDSMTVENTSDMDNPIVFTEFTTSWTDASGQAVTDGIKNVGIYTVNVTASQNITADDGTESIETYAGSATFEVTPMTLEVIWNNGTYVWDGTTVHYPTATVNGVTITKCKDAVTVAGDATVTLLTSVDETVEPGKYKAYLELSDTHNYQLSVDKCAYEVNKVTVSADMFTFDKSKTLDADESDHTPEIKLSDGTELPNNDYSVELKKDGTSVTKISEVGVYDIVIAATDANKYYTGNITEKYEVKYSDEAPTVSVSDNTLNVEGNEWYRGEVTVTVDPGYVIAKTEAEAKDLSRTNTSVVYTTVPDNYDVYLRSTKDNTISKQTIKNFKIDSAKPTVELDATNTNTNVTEWLSEKYFTVILNDTESGIYKNFYYTTDDTKKLTVNTITNESELSDLTAITKDKTKVSITENVESNVYYVYAIDNAGYVSDMLEIPVTNIDSVAPIVTLDEKGTNCEVTGSGDTKEVVYWKNSTDLKIPVTDLSDDLSGLASVTLVKDGGTQIDLGTNVTEITISGTDAAQTAGNYVLSVKDKAGNETTCEFIVKVDTSNPELTLTEPAHVDKYSAGDVFWYPQSELSITADVVDRQPENEEISENTVWLSIDGGDFSKVSHETDGKVNITLAKGEHTYTLKVTDKAGNPSEEKILKLGYAPDAPVIESVEINPVVDENGNGLADEWINQSELGEDKKIEFIVTIKDEFTGIKTIFYQHDGDTPVEVNINAADQKNDTFTIVTEETYDSDCTNCQWTFKAVNNVNKESKEKTTEQIAGIDVTAPEEKVYIQFFSDTVGSNDLDRGNETKNGWASGIYEMATGAWNKLWGKEKISFEIYVKDGISKSGINGSGIAGPEAVEMTYTEAGSTEDKTIILTDVPGMQAFDVDTELSEDSDNLKNQGYTIFTGEICYPKNQGISINNFRIKSIADIAGNVTSGIVLEGIEDGDIIYLDAEAPKLISVETEHAANDSIKIENENKYFYKDSEKIQLTLKERFFGMEQPNAVYPEVIVKSRIYEETREFVENAALNKNIWNSLNDDYQWELNEKINLPKSDQSAGEEIEYRLEMNYSDPSGNLLTTENPNLKVNDGTFTSDIYVVDTLAPELKSFKITDSNGAALSTDEGLDFAQNIDGDDVKITVTIDDNANYFNSDNVSLFYDTDEDGEWQPLVLKDWSGDGREWTASCTFDGVVNEEHTYRFKVVYFDRAQNAMINNGATVDAVTEEAGAFISTQKVVIDHSNPKMTQLLFDTPVQIFDEEFNEENGTASDSITNADSRMYYDANAEISFDIDDKYLKASDITINVYKRADKLVAFDENKPAVTNNIADGDAFKFTMPDEDAEYYFTISYTDRAGNLMEYSTDEDGAVNVNDKVNEAYDKGVDAGTYTSPIIIRDTVNPEFTVTYTANGSETDLAEHNYNIDSITALIEVTEMNLDMENTKITVTAKDINGNDITCDKVTNYNGSWQDVAKKTGQSAAASRVDGKLDQRSLEITFTTEANYTIQIEVIDKVGKEAESHTKKFCIDRTVPTIKVVDVDNKEYTNDVVQGALVNMEKSDITYTVVNTGKFSQIINKLTFGYFANAKIQVQIKAHDQISGVQNIVYTYTDVNGTAKTVTATPMLFSADDKSCSVITFELPISFKGQVKAYGIDNTGNSAEKTPSGAIGVIAETEKTHKETSNVDLEVLSSYSKTPDYYNGDVKIKFTAQDGYSGLYFIQYIAGNDLNQKVSYAESGVEIVTSAIFRNHTINASANNENNILLGLSLEDNAGYTREIPEEELPKIHIDTTAPKVEVEYDNNDVLNEKYYKADRIATVTVTERNFDPDDVHFELTGPRPSIGNWVHTAGSGCAGGSDPHDTHHTDSCRWSCKVHFSVDGDYTFGFRCVDLAGNEGKYDRVDEFTIDKKFPIITVVYDNNNFQNEYYYKEARTATITIEEHNFSPNDVVITMTAKDDGRIIAVPGVSGWSSEGDYHRATIHYNYDAEFTFDIEFIDLAGNQAEDYEMDHFVVDMTAPELEIFDIEHMSANNGVVRPGIRYYDTNYDKDGTVILMTGYHNGVVEMTGARKLEANGLELKLDDFAYVQEMDDLYTMEATVYDLAGNSSEAMVMFSVNRFGSVYTFDKATDALIGDNGKYYTNKEQELVITETNVDTLEFKEITMNLNGKLTTLKEGVDYTVRLEGNDATWKQYTYTLKAENFVEEGTYILTIYSEDRATNTSDNNTKGKKVEFVVDKTNPSALISGVENGGQYRANSKEMTIDVEDNIRLSQVVVTIDGVETVYDAAQINEVDGKLVLNIGSANHWQDVKVVVTDAAGNEEISEEMRVLVTANIFVQFFMNKPVFYGTLGGGAVLAALLWWFLVGKKKKKEEEQAQ